MADEIDNAKPQTVGFVNVEAIPLGAHKDFLYAICGGLAELVDLLVEKKIAITGTIRDARVLPWNLVSRIDKGFKGIPPLQRIAKPVGNRDNQTRNSEP